MGSTYWIVWIRLDPESEDVKMEDELGNEKQQETHDFDSETKRCIEEINDIPLVQTDKNNQYQP